MKMGRRKIVYILVGIDGERSRKIDIGYLESLQNARDIARRISDFTFN